MRIKIEGIGYVNAGVKPSEHHQINPAAWSINEETGLAELAGNPWVYSDALHWDAIRAERAPLLAEADELVKRAEDANPAAADVYRAYRQALRDVPQTYVNPDDVVWPTKPMGV